MRRFLAAAAPIRRAWSALARGRNGATSLEVALVFPTFLLFIFGMFAVYTLISARRAMDYGVEKALRYAVVHGGGGTGGNTAVGTAFANAASVVWPAVGANAVVTVTPAAGFKAGDTVVIAVSYAWSAPATTKSNAGVTLFQPVTLNASASMRVVN